LLACDNVNCVPNIPRQTRQYNHNTATHNTTASGLTSCIALATHHVWTMLAWPSSNALCRINEVDPVILCLCLCRYCKTLQTVEAGYAVVDADSRSGHGLDVDGTRQDVDILKVTLGFLCRQPQPVRPGNPEFQKKMVVCLQNAFDAGEIYGGL